MESTSSLQVSNGSPTFAAGGGPFGKTELGHTEKLEHFFGAAP